MSFYKYTGNLLVDERKRLWIDWMSGLAFEKVERGNLYTDNGLTRCYAIAKLEDGREITFTIIVQGNGLAISNVCFDGLYDTAVGRQMTTYNPG